MTERLGMFSFCFLVLMGLGTCSDSNRQSPDFDYPRDREQAAPDEEPFASKDRISPSPHRFGNDSSQLTRIGSAVGNLIANHIDGSRICDTKYSSLIRRARLWIPDIPLSFLN